MIGGLLGNRTGKNSFEKSGGSSWLINSKFAVAGFLLTFVYDLFTNIVSGFVAGIPITVALISGIPFALAHEVSNTAFFFFGASSLVKAIGRLFQGGSC